MHRAFHGLRPFLGVGPSTAGDSVSKATTLINGLNNSTDELTDNFGGPYDARRSLRAPPTPLRPLTAPFHSRHAQDFSLLNQHITHLPPPQCKPPTPISTLLAFKQQHTRDSLQVPSDYLSQVLLPDIAEPPPPILSVPPPAVQPLPQDRAALTTSEKPQQRVVAHRTRNYVQKACVHCKSSHVACDSARPCQRCIRLGKGDSCIDAARKRRGRPNVSSRKRGIDEMSSDGSPNLDSTTSAATFDEIDRDIKRIRTMGMGPLYDPMQSAAYHMAQDDQNALSEVLAAEIGTQLYKLQADIQSGNDTLSMEAIEAIGALSMLLPETNGHFM
ncbi:hypothetical protein DFS34DRAFT_589956 [Phlyctochytrium arcticum]|nr:hypothetical protein DFS34DRAFT_589956 [Phlyctochytrium arcticum]